jgi:hypothetical protein
MFCGLLRICALYPLLKKGWDLGSSSSHLYKVYICFFHRLEIKLKYEHSQQDKMFVL